MRTDERGLLGGQVSKYLRFYSTVQRQDVFCFFRSDQFGELLSSKSAFLNHGVSQVSLLDFLLPDSTEIF